MPVLLAWGWTLGLISRPCAAGCFLKEKQNFCGCVCVFSTAFNVFYSLLVGQGRLHLIRKKNKNHQPHEGVTESGIWPLLPCPRVRIRMWGSGPWQQPWVFPGRNTFSFKVFLFLFSLLVCSFCFVRTPVAAHPSTSVLGNFLEPARTNVWGALVTWMPAPLCQGPCGSDRSCPRGQGGALGCPHALNA